MEPEPASGKASQIQGWQAHILRGLPCWLHLGNSLEWGGAGPWAEQAGQGLGSAGCTGSWHPCTASRGRGRRWAPASGTPKPGTGSAPFPGYR